MQHKKNMGKKFIRLSFCRVLYEDIDPVEYESKTLFRWVVMFKFEFFLHYYYYFHYSPIQRHNRAAMHREADGAV
jgi:hypothetical protein